MSNVWVVTAKRKRRECFYVRHMIGPVNLCLRHFEPLQTLRLCLPLSHTLIHALSRHPELNLSPAQPDGPPSLVWFRVPLFHKKEENCGVSFAEIPILIRVPFASDSPAPKQTTNNHLRCPDCHDCARCSVRMPRQTPRLATGRRPLQPVGHSDVSPLSLEVILRGLQALPLLLSPPGAWQVPGHSHVAAWQSAQTWRGCQGVEPRACTARPRRP